MHGATTTGASAKELPRGEGRTNSSSGFAFCLRGVGRATSTGALCMESRNASQTGVLALQVTGHNAAAKVTGHSAAAAGSRETPLEPAACVCRFNAPSRGALSSFYMQFLCCIVLPVCSAFSKLASFGWFLASFASLASAACNFLVSLF